MSTSGELADGSIGYVELDAVELVNRALAVSRDDLLKLTLDVRHPRYGHSHQHSAYRGRAKQAGSSCCGSCCGCDCDQVSTAISPCSLQSRGVVPPRTPHNLPTVFPSAEHRSSSRS